MAAGEGASVSEFGTRKNGMVYVDRPGVYALIENKTGQVAVIETSDGCFLPGGGIDAGETEVDALKREILEETGYQASVLMFAGEAVEYVDASGEDKHYQISSRFYRVQLGSKVSEGVEKDQRLVWLLPEEAAKLLNRQGQAWIVIHKGR